MAVITVGDEHEEISVAVSDGSGGYEYEERMSTQPDNKFTVACTTIGAMFAIGVIGFILYLIFFVGPNNNGDRAVQINRDRLEACGQPESSGAAEVAVCVKALEAEG